MRTRDAHSGRTAYLKFLAVVGPEEDKPSGDIAAVRAVVGSRNAEGTRQIPRCANHFRSGLVNRVVETDLRCSEQDGTSGSFRLGYDVHTPVKSVTSIHVQIARGPEHYGAAWRRTPKRV